MSDVSFTFGMKDEVTPVIKRQKAEADGLQKSLKEAGQAAARAGGPLGGIAGRVLGGAGGPMAVIAAAAVAAGIALSAVNAISDRAIANAKEQVTWAERLTKAYEAGAKARAGTAAAGLSQAADTRLLLTRGGNVDDAKADQQNAGVDLADALKGQAALQLVAGGRRGAVREGASQLASTGEISFTDAVKRLAARMGAIDVRRELVGIRGQSPTQDNLDSAGNAFDRAKGGGNYLTNKQLGKIRTAQQAGQSIGLAQSEDLTGGSTAAALEGQARDALDPTAKAVSDLRAEVEAGARQLEAAARSQVKQVALIASLGKALGGEGSEQDKLTNYRRNTRAVTE